MNNPIIILLTLIACLTASATESSVSYICTTGPVKTSVGIKTYEAHVLSKPNAGGIYGMQVYSNMGKTRKALPLVEVFWRGEFNNRVSSLVDVKSRRPVLVYKERAAPTREGTIEIQDGKEFIQVETTCYL